jgi:hypothetical protein
LAPLPGNAKPPPHPERVAIPPSEASSRTVSVIHRLPCLLVAKSRPASESRVVASDQPDRLPAGLIAVDAVWILNCEVADELPGVIEGGEKVAVAPGGSPLAANITGLENVPFCAFTVMEYWAVPPGVTVCAEVDEVIKKLGVAVPVPLKATVCGVPDALSAIDSVAVKLPVEGGVKITEIAQLEFASSDSPQVFVWLKSAGLAPVIVLPLMLSTALPGLERVTVWALAVVPVVVMGKVRAVGENTACGTGTAVPVPCNVVVCGEPDALSAMESVAAKLAIEAGENVTDMKQEEPAASDVPQVFV